MTVETATLADLPGPMRWIEPDVLAQLAALGQERAHATGDLILRVNHPADHFHVLTSGRFRVGLSVLGRAPLTLQTLRPGEIAGLSWMWPPHRWQWDVTAQEPSTSIEFDAATVRERCDRDARFKAAVLGLVVNEVRDRLSHARLQLLDMYGVPQR